MSLRFIILFKAHFCALFDVFFKTLSQMLFLTVHHRFRQFYFCRFSDFIHGFVFCCSARISLQTAVKISADLSTQVFLAVNCVLAGNLLEELIIHFRQHRLLNLNNIKFIVSHFSGNIFVLIIVSHFDVSLFFAAGLCTGQSFYNLGSHGKVVKLKGVNLRFMGNDDFSAVVTNRHAVGCAHLVTVFRRTADRLVSAVAFSHVVKRFLNHGVCNFKDRHFNFDRAELRQRNFGFYLNFYCKSDIFAVFHRQVVNGRRRNRLKIIIGAYFVKHMREHVFKCLAFYGFFAKTHFKDRAGSFPLAESRDIHPLGNFAVGRIHLFGKICLLNCNLDSDDIFFL